MTAPQLGVVGAPDIASALSTLGFDVVTGDNFRDAATAISGVLRSGPIPIVVADDGSSMMAPWTTVTRSKAASLVVLDTHPGSTLLSDSPEVHLAVPAAFNDLLAKIGYAGAPDPLGSRVISADGSLIDPAAQPAPLPVPLPAPLPAVVEAPVPTPAPEGPVFGAPSTPPLDEAPAAPELPAGPVFGAPAPVGATPAGPVFGAPAIGEAPSVPGFGVSAPAVADAPSVPAFRVPAFGVPAPVGEVAPEPQPVEVVEDLDVAPSPVAPFGGYLLPSTDEAQQPEVAPPAPQDAPSPVFAVPAPVGAPYSPPAVAPAPTPQPWDVGTPAERPPVAPFVPQQVASEPAPVAAYAQPWIEHEPAAPHVAEPVAEPAHIAEPVAKARPNVRMGSKHGEVVFSAAGKGGVGKTSSAILIADAAAEQGMQAILIDANRGQADIRKYLRLGDTALRSAYDAYQHGSPAAALLMPKDYAHLRTAAKLDVPDYGIVLGPPSDLAGSRYASASIYGDIIDYARSIADIVIVDTQIMEAPEERTDLWRDTVIPMLGGDAWLLGITDESAAGIDNLHERLTELHREGVLSSRTLILASQFLEFGADEIDYFQRKFNGLGSFVGNTGVDDDFSVQLNLGKVNGHSPSVRPAIDNILLRVTNRTDLFSPREPAPQPRFGKPAGGKFGLFGKKKSA